MTVKPCSNVVKDLIYCDLSVSEHMTSEQFDKGWRSKFGDARPLSTGFYPFGMHAICMASWEGNIALIHHIYKKDHSVLHLADKNGWTPLFYATFRAARDFNIKCVESAETLLELGADPNVPIINEIPFGVDEPSTPANSTSLWTSAESINGVAITKLLLKFGAIAVPELGVTGQQNFEQAQKDLASERADLLSVINTTLPDMPSVLLQTIIEYA